MLYPELTKEAFAKLPYAAREIIKADHRLDEFRKAPVLTLEQCETYRELLADKQRLVGACETTYGKAFNTNGSDSPSFA